MWRDVFTNIFLTIVLIGVPAVIHHYWPKKRDESGAEVSQAGLSFAVISVSLAGLAVQAIASRSHSRWSWVKINWS